MIMQQTITHLNTSPEHDQTIMEQFQQGQPWRLATAIDLQGCNPLLIRSAEYIRAFVDALCTLIDMKKFGPTTIVNFGEDPRVSGYSMTQLIETSLISGHFANQPNAAYIDIFSCKAYQPPIAACTGYLEYPFQNKQLFPCSENRFRDVAKERRSEWRSSTAYFFLGEADKNALNVVDCEQGHWLKQFQSQCSNEPACFEACTRRRMVSRETR